MKKEPRKKNRQRRLRLAVKKKARRKRRQKRKTRRTKKPRIRRKKSPRMSASISTAFKTALLLCRLILRSFVSLLRLKDLSITRPFRFRGSRDRFLARKPRSTPTI